jgi:beta-phosphoglucomutase
MSLQAVIFDLDGVLTDTAEYHYLAWKRLAEEEGLVFDRQINERLRGVPRRESLRLILGERQETEAAVTTMMARKNGYYQELLAQLSPADLLPGVAELLDLLDGAKIPCAVASASKNAPEAARRLGIADRLALVADGNSVRRQKPAPDLFRFAAAGLNLPPAACLVVEDAAAGIEAALAAGMPALALGPADRFAEGIVGLSRQVARREHLVGVSLAELEAICQPDPTWSVVQNEFTAEKLRHMETVFTSGNGYFSSRGSFEEGFPDELVLTLAHGVFDDMPISVTELANLPNWLDCRLTVNGRSFRMDQGGLLFFQRRMDLRQGVLQRDVRWRSPDGVVVDLTFERFISYAHEHLSGLRLLVTAVDQPCQITVESSIDGHVANGDLLHWHHLEQGGEGNQVWLHSRTRHSGLALATAVAATSSSPTPIRVRQCPGQPTLISDQPLEPGETLQLEKLTAYTASRDAVPQAEAVVARAAAQLAGQSYDALKLAHLAAWNALWERIDVEIEGDDEAQLAIRFNLFQLQVAAPQRDDRVSMGAKTLSGLGYRGHVFWDTEIFILPFFIYTQPRIARNMLMYRYHTLAGARRKAANNGFAGAQYAWESAVTGDEVTPTFVPDFDGKGLVRIWTGDIELHISADVAYAVDQYWRVTGDDLFMRDYGAEMILDTAVFWGERAEYEPLADGRYQYAIRDVIGPDEYHDHVDNNIFTNWMIRWHLQKAGELLAWLEEAHPAQAEALRDRRGLTVDRLAHWQDVIDHIVILHDPETGLMTQFDDFFEREEVDWAAYVDRTESMQVLLGIEGANASQVIKQADVIMLLCLLRDEFDRRTWRKNWDTYVPLTDHSYGSSLGPAFHAWAACEMDEPETAYDHFMRAARADLQDVRGNAGDGIHAASAGGLWQAAVFGFAGLRLTDGCVALRPRLPQAWRRLAFSVWVHGRRHKITIRSADDFDIES